MLRATAASMAAECRPRPCRPARVSAPHAEPASTAVVGAPRPDAGAPSGTRAPAPLPCPRRRDTLGGVLRRRCTADDHLGGFAPAGDAQRVRAGADVVPEPSLPKEHP